jgi:uncharacterized metal-binding protein YceD (DUF177 family)
MLAGYRPENAAKMASLVIPIHHLDTQGKDYVFALDQAWLDGAFEGTGVRGDAAATDGAVEVHAQRNGREILVHGKAHARLVTECGRCLKDLGLEVACDLAALYTPSEGSVRAAPDDDEELDDVDPTRPDREFYSGDQVVIDDLVRDYLLLELPMQPRCDLGWSCPNLDVPEHMRAGEGVHSQSSGEGHIDPRLVPLMKLAKGEPDKE